ncbi:hypothetical protein R3P38DRAFT_3068371 [Favolaschia claudopus]|uniref:Uncharacterized protein n=1 Tax=Favolaschia claudopus TaxID=2862362 RepID=A0AAW0A053_9AGAR
MAPQNPLEIQELLDHCIGFLAGSTSALLACALVARSWAHTSQSHLFRSPSDTNPKFPRRGKLILGFHNALCTSDHLVREVLELSLEVGQLGSDTVDAICSIGFTHLVNLRLTMPWEEHLLPGSALERLVNLPTLRRLSFTANLPLSKCTPLCSHCSRTIRHFEFEFYEPAALPWEATLAATPFPFQLESLRIYVYGENPHEVLELFDFSQSKAVSLDIGVYIPWESISLSQSRIRILDLDVVEESDLLDLSQYSELQYLRLHFNDVMPPMVLPTLDSLRRCKNLLELVLSGPYHTLVEEHCLQIDAVLSSLPSPPLAAVEIEQRDGFDSSICAHFPTLLSQDTSGKIEFRTVRGSSALATSRWRDVISRL